MSLGRGAQVALLAERNGVGEAAPFQPSAYTYAELTAAVNRLANALRSRGVKKGDVVGIFMAHVPEAAVAMLACARIGAVHCVVFGGFSKEALAGRLIDSGARVMVTQDGVMRGGKFVALKAIVDAAAPLVEASGGAGIKACIVLKRLGTESCRASHDMVDGRDAWWHEAVEGQSVEVETEWVDAEDPAFILYTSGGRSGSACDRARCAARLWQIRGRLWRFCSSVAVPIVLGSTGKPKGILHTTGGYMLGAATSFK